MKKSDFYYELPDELIAQTPIYPRDHSRMLVYDRQSDTIEHKQFFNLVDYLEKGDVLVINDTKVIPARLHCHREGKPDEVIEILLLKRIDYYHYECIVKPAKKLKIGTVIEFNDELSAQVTEICDQGIRIIKFAFEGVFEDILDRIGSMPLPPYITETLEDKDRYQTVYCSESGSSAAPTAGLHFTTELLDSLKEKGVEIARVLLHVGLGTFRPVKVDDILTHNMHSEYCSINQANTDIINKATSENRRVICVGTTSVRVVESLSDDNGVITATSRDTNIFIYPGYKFKVVKALVTNFHLPESTLIMLVSALCGREKTLEMYNKAVSEKYRFFSFGDATFIK